MHLYDRELAEIVDTSTRVEVDNKLYTIKSNRSGSCNGCAFEHSKCSQAAIRFCTSNGGNILIKAEPNKK